MKDMLRLGNNDRKKYIIISATVSLSYSVNNCFDNSCAIKA